MSQRTRCKSSIAISGLRFPLHHKGALLGNWTQTAARKRELAKKMRAENRRARLPRPISYSGIWGATLGMIVNVNEALIFLAREAERKQRELARKRLPLFVRVTYARRNWERWNVTYI